ALVGFRERASPYIAEIERCHVLADPVGPLVGALGTLIGGLSIRERVPQIEVAIADETVALVFRVLDAPAAADVASLTAFGVAHGIDIWLQPGGYETVAALTPPVRPLTYSLPDFDVTLQFEPCDFVQVNAPLNRLMVARAVSLLDPQPADSVLDLYCGLGNFSLPLARRAASVVGVEGDASLVARARANAERNGLGNVSFHVANLASDLRGSPWLERGYDLVLLDPPRAGAAEVLPAVVAARPRRIVYVSCHPGTLARDAGVLVHEHGYRLTAAGAMDMFPHTAHVESIAVFETGGRR
ncbi:MAG: 23S rRNA (uracil(1939)-C(5))-methyltransferase RlmD, partial [Gammaproteobacteria bacterium]|nr:23S rRNA (uracil(1939)-C(5))-methyltransferase RlmD [Gammaproteobacteria bacterium]